MCEIEFGELGSTLKRLDYQLLFAKEYQDHSTPAPTKIPSQALLKVLSLFNYVVIKRRELEQTSLRKVKL